MIDQYRSPHLRRTALAALATAVVFAGLSPPSLSETAPEEQPRNNRPAAATTRPAGPPPEEKSSVTHHKGHFGGQDINYTATAATYNIKDNEGKVKATFFFVAYTKDGDDVARRPVSFVYNGGPGSGSNFTHMGLGPKEPILSDDGHGSPAPYLTEDNPNSFFDATDMVFIDAVSTGFSRAAPGEKPSQFYGVEQDATIFSDFIYEYLTRNERWASPKFLIGESYGTTRSAMLSNILDERHQIYLNGVVLLSSVGFGNWGADDRAKYFLPTYVTSAWFHKLLPPDLQKLTHRGSCEAGTAVRAWRVRSSAREGRSDFAGGLSEGRQGPGPLHRTFHNLYRRVQSADQSAALVQRAAAEQARNHRASRLAVHRLRCRRRRRTGRVRFERGVLRRRLRRCVSGSLAPRLEVEQRHVLPRDGQRPAVGSGQGRSSGRSTASGDDSADAFEAAGAVRLLRSGDSL